MSVVPVDEDFTFKCQNCEENPAELLHGCPYDEELGSGEKRCNCCDDCRSQCAMDI